MRQRLALPGIAMKSVITGYPVTVFRQSRLTEELHAGLQTPGLRGQTGQGASPTDK